VNDGALCNLGINILLSYYEPRANILVTHQFLKAVAKKVTPLFIRHDGGSTYLQNVCEHLPDSMESHLRR
jgi:hypothetical protein